jgi:hypothetical protein
VHTPAFVWTRLVIFWSASVRERGDGFQEAVVLELNHRGLTRVTKSLPEPLVAFSSRVSVMKINRIKSLLVAAII